VPKHVAVYVVLLSLNAFFNNTLTLTAMLRTQVPFLNTQLLKEIPKFLRVPPGDNPRPTI